MITLDLIGTSLVLLVALFSIMILIQVILSVVAIIKKVTIYNKNRETINKIILENRNATLYDFLSYHIEGQIMKAFSKNNYDLFFDKTFRLSKIKNFKLKEDLKSYRNISRIQIFLGNILIASIITFLFLIISFGGLFRK